MINWIVFLIKSHQTNLFYSPFEFRNLDMFLNGIYEDLHYGMQFIFVLSPTFCFCSAERLSKCQMPKATDPFDIKLDFHNPPTPFKCSHVGASLSKTPTYGSCHFRNMSLWNTWQKTGATNSLSIIQFLWFFYFLTNILKRQDTILN